MQASHNSSQDQKLITTATLFNLLPLFSFFQQFDYFSQIIFNPIRKINIHRPLLAGLTMPSKRPEFLQGSYYHIFNRGAHQRSIFKDNENYLFVLRKIKYYSIQFQHTIIAYCLMPNHYHLLIRQNGGFKASLLPQQVFNSYTKAFNKRYNRTGTLFEDSFHIKTIEDTSHLLHLCRYIHGNPVKDGFVSDPSDWEYSNFREFIGSRAGSLFDPGFFTDFFEDSKDYYNYVMEDLTTRDLPISIRDYLDLLER